MRVDPSDPALVMTNQPPGEVNVDQIDPKHESRSRQRSNGPNWGMVGGWPRVEEGGRAATSGHSVVTRSLQPLKPHFTYHETDRRRENEAAPFFPIDGIHWRPGQPNSLLSRENTTTPTSLLSGMEAENLRILHQHQHLYFY